MKKNKDDPIKTWLKCRLKVLRSRLYAVLVGPKTKLEAIKNSNRIGIC